MKLCHYWWLYDAEHGSTDFQSCPSVCYLSFQRREAQQEMLTLYCYHVASCWLIKISSLNCSTPYIFYLTSHLIKKYDEKDYWTWNSPCLLVLSSYTFTDSTKYHFHNLCIQFSTPTIIDIHLYYKQKLEYTSYTYRYICI